MLQKLLKLALIAPALGSGGFNFLVMGDWGGTDCSATSHDCSTPQEVATAKGMQSVGDTKQSRFALALGDNFYTHGVTNVDSNRFKYTFEDVFTNQFPFHVLAGNHDHLGNVSAQIDYSGRSKRWSFPDLYYAFTEEGSAPGTSVQIIMLDTVILAGNSDVPIEGTNLVKELHGDELPGPSNSQLAQTQMEWLETTLAASTADYVLVTGHYPVYSICEHGPTTQLVNDVKPLLEKYNVSAWLNGHDHCAEYIDVGDGVQYHTIGSAHLNDPSTKHASAIPSGSLKWHYGTGNGGFASIQVESSGLTIVHHDGDGKEVYTAPTIAPRN